MARRGRLQAAAVLQLGLVVLSNLPLVCDSQTEPEECTGVIREPTDAWPDCATVERFIDLFAVQFDQQLDEKCFNSGVAEQCPICNKWAESKGKAPTCIVTTTVTSTTTTATSITSTTSTGTVTSSTVTSSTVTITTSTFTTSTTVNFTASAGYEPSLYELAYESDFCECDLTAQHCDANCCCDTQCSLDDASVFNGGDGCVDSTPPTLFEHSCDFDWDAGHPAEREVVTTDLRRFFCVLRENNPLAGNFHTPRETLPATEDEIEDLLTTTDTAKRFPVKAPPATYDVSPRQRTGYGNPGTGAAPVKVASPPPPAMYKSGSKMPTSNVDSNLFGTMTIPTTFISGSCVDNPVRMLEDTTTTCTRVRAEIKNDCAAFGKFDAKLYMYATNFLLQKVGDRSTQPDELLDMPRWFSWTRTSTGETKRLNGVHFEDVASSAAKGDSNGGDSNGHHHHRHKHHHHCHKHHHHNNNTKYDDHCDHCEHVAGTAHQHNFVDHHHHTYHINHHHIN